MKKAPSDTGGACLVRLVWLQPNDTAQVPPVVVLVVVVVFLIIKLNMTPLLMGAPEFVKQLCADLPAGWTGAGATAIRRAIRQSPTENPREPHVCRTYFFYH